MQRWLYKVHTYTTKKRIFLSDVDPFKEQKSTGEWTIQMEFLLWLSEIVQKFQNTHLSGRPTYLFQMEGGER